MNPFYIGVPLYLAFGLIGYLVREYAIGKLEALELGTLAKSMRWHRLSFLKASVILLLMFFVFRYSFPALAETWFLIFLFMWAIAIVFFEVSGWRKCRILNYSKQFVKPYMVSRISSILGALCFLGAMAATPFVELNAK